MKNSIPVALSIAGFDNSCGAGVTADSRTFERLGVYGVCAITGIAAQSPGHFSSVTSVPRHSLVDQLNEIAGAFPIAAIKIGMLTNAELADSVVKSLETHFKNMPVVIDPVLKATAGNAELSNASLIAIYQDDLFARSSLVTPNISEAEHILDSRIQSFKDLENSAAKFYDRFGSPVLLKGGHLETCSDTVHDAFCDSSGQIEILSSPKLNIPDLHGTGCVLSSAITAHLAKGADLRTSIKNGRENLHFWMKNHHSWESPSRGTKTHALNAISED